MRALAPTLLLSLVLAGCGDEGPTDPTLAESAEGHFVVSFRAETEPPPIHEIHRWRIHLEDASGQPLEGAFITVDGGMPEHQHGLPTQPQVTQDLGGGDYLVEGMKFSMGGYWVLDLTIAVAGKSDGVRFERTLIE